jgi:hypothetical protein
MQPLLNKMLQAVKVHMETAHYKCERPSAENLSEFVAKLVQLDNVSREWIFNNMLPTLVMYSNYMIGKDTMAKVFLLKAIQTILTTSEQSTQPVMVCKDMSIIQEITGLLIDSCQSGDLVLIASALDAFYDIFSEDFYD